VRDNLPLQGRILWPGASATPPLQWPGWKLLPNGTYVPTNGNFAWTRKGVLVMFDVNPHFQTVVNYPPASSKCANPPNKPRTPPPPTAGTNTPPGPPTAVNAGLSGDSIQPGSRPVGKMLSASGLLLIVVSLIVLVGGRRRGAHEA
jgi:hypothetical protein